MKYQIDFKNKKEIEELLIVLSIIENAAGGFPHSDLNKLKSKLNKVINKKPIKSKSRKSKGRNLQHFVCERIASIFDILFDNQDDHCLIHSREMGQSGIDVVLRGEVFDKFKFDIECKSTEKFHIYNDIEQAKRNTGVNRDWLLVHKKNKNKPIVVMEWDSFENLIKKTVF